MRFFCRTAKTCFGGERTVIGFDQADCFWTAGTGLFKPASRASRSARNRAVFSRVAALAAWYSAIACCPSRSCCSFFLKIASARSRARLASVFNPVTPFKRIRLQDRLSCLASDAACRWGMLNEATPFPIICSAHPGGRRDRLVSCQNSLWPWGACSGRSARFSPLRMRPVGTAGYRVTDFGHVSRPLPGDRHDSPQARSLRAG